MVRIDDIALYYLSIATERTLSFGNALVDRVTVVRLAITGHRLEEPATATGWADIPLNLSWAWPDYPLPSAERAARALIASIRTTLVGTTVPEDPFRWHLEALAPTVARAVAEYTAQVERVIPDLVASLAAAPFDIAWHDLFGNLNDRPTWSIYRRPWVTTDLASLCPSHTLGAELLDGLYPADFLNTIPLSPLIAWHLVGITDPVGVSDDKNDLLSWITRDRLFALKVKLNGINPDAAVDRLVSVVEIARGTSVRLLSVDFNGTLSGTDGYEQFVRSLFERSRDIADGTLSLTMIEQPFMIGKIPRSPRAPAGCARPLLTLDESIVDPVSVVEAHAAGWDGIVVKTCKTQTQAILLAAIARRLGMRVIVQDLTNPMLALLAHLQLAAHINDGWGVEVNATQYYPRASAPEARIHQGAFERVGGSVSVDTLTGPGIGYRIGEISRALPSRAA